MMENPPPAGGPETRLGPGPEGWLLVRSESLPEHWRSRAIVTSLVPLTHDECVGLLSERGVRDRLGPRDLELLSLLTSGLTIDQIARRLRVNRRTVERRLAKLRAPFGASSTAQLIVEAARRGF